MDVKDLIGLPYLTDKMSVVITGWIVDRPAGLLILGDHNPPDYRFPIFIKIKNFNIIYPILAEVPKLAGGNSLLFYRTIIGGEIIIDNDLLVQVDTCSIETVRGSGVFYEINLDRNALDNYVNKFGDYVFCTSVNVSDDWINDVPN